MKRNNALEIYRIIFTLAVVLQHFENVVPYNYINMGYLGVEFFFGMSGYFLAQSFERKNKTIQGYIAGRIARLWPANFLALVLCSLIYPIVLDTEISKIRFVAEAFMLQEWGILTNLGPTIIPQCWYISALMLASIIMYIFLYSYGWDKIKGFIFTLIILGYSFLFHSEKGIEVWGMSAKGMVSLPVFRAMCGIMAGVLIYYISNRINLRDKLCKIIIRIGEIVSWCVLILTFLGIKNREDIMVIALFFLLFAATTPNSWLRFTDNVDLKVMSQFSYPLFLNHIVIMHIFSRYVNSTTHSKLKSLILYAVMLLVYNIIFICLLEFLRRYIKRIFSFIKNESNNIN